MFFLVVINYVHQSDHLNSLYKCNNVSWPSPSSSSEFSGYKCNKLHWFRKTDGSCNNLIYSWWGAAKTPFKRLAKPAYADDKEKPRKYSVFGQPLKSPRLIATTIHSSQDQYSTISHFLPLFGQYLMHDMTRSGHSLEPSSNHAHKSDQKDDNQIKKCPCNSRSPSCINMEIPEGDPILSGSYDREAANCLVQIRHRDSRRDFDCDLGHREQINEATAWLDQSNTYGNDDRQTRSLRLFKNGRLKTSHFKDDDNRKYDYMPSKCDANKDFKLLLKDDVCFKSGDDRVNENPLLAGVHTIFLREHNHVVDELSVINRKWDDERLYQEGRRIMNAIYQHIVYAEWLPAVLGEHFYQAFGLAPQYQGFFYNYDPYIVPNIAIEFAAAAGRFGHALIRSLFSEVSRSNTVVGNMSLSDSLFRPHLLIENGESSFNNLMRGCIRDIGNSNPPHVTKDLLDYLVVDHGNHNPTHYHSLPAININRGRDVALQPYNKYRAMAGLNYANSFEELTWITPDIQRLLSTVYASVNDIDLFTGGLSETKVPGGLVGPTFACECSSPFLSEAESTTLNIFSV